MKNTIRWILLLPSMVAAWIATFYLAIFSIPVFEHIAMTATQTSDGSLQYENNAVEYAMVFGGSLSACLVVGVAALVAPARKVLFAWLALGLGGLVATSMYVSLGDNFTAVYFGAIISGTLTAGTIQWRYGHASPGSELMDQSVKTDSGIRVR